MSLRSDGLESTTLNSPSKEASSISLYDTTLRDGAQAEGIHFSLSDKLKIASRLDLFGMEFIEGGWPGSNPKDIEFFTEVKKLHLNRSKVAAFGSTRRAGVAVEDDSQVALLLNAETPVVTLVCKASLLHVREVLRISPEENLAMIRDTIAYLKSHGREVIFDGEHTFDGLKENLAYTTDCFQAAAGAGASCLVPCDTNGGSLPREITTLMLGLLGNCHQALVWESTPTMTVV